MRPTYYRFTLGSAAVLLGSLCSGCPAPPKFDGPNLHLVDLAETAVLIPGEPPTLPPDARVDWVREGSAMLAVDLAAADAKLVPAPFERTYVWSLPLARTKSTSGTTRTPSVEGMELTHFPQGAGEALKGDGGVFKVRVDECFVQLREGDVLPETLRLHYPVPAALLVGTKLIEGAPMGDALALRNRTGEIVEDAYAIPVGATLQLSMPIMAAGRVIGGLRAMSVRGERGDPANVNVHIRLGGKELASIECDSSGGPTRFEVPLDRLHRPGKLEFHVEGSPESVVFLAAPVHSRPRTVTDPKNAVLILVDTLRADRLGAYGSKLKITPNMDQFARESLTFLQCWSTASWTLPSVTSILTSNHGGQHGAWFNDRRLGEGIDTLPELMRNAGYMTAAFTDGAFLAPAFGLDRGFSTFDATGGGVEAVVARAQKWLESAGEGPWFVFVHTYEVHSPYEPPKAVEKEILARHPGGLRGLRPEPQDFYALVQKSDKELKKISRLLRELYDAEVEYTDGVVGGFLDHLRERGLFDDTAIVLTSDHGEEFGEHGLLGHGDSLYVEQLHVPFIVHLPRGKRADERDRRAGERDQRPVSQLDLAPTLLYAAGAYDLRLESTFVGDTLLPRGAPSPIYATRNVKDVGLLHTYRQGARTWIDGPYVYERGVKGMEYFSLSTDPWQQRDKAAQEGPAVKKGR
jgi:arylsulfatase A-like enzyme